MSEDEDMNWLAHIDPSVWLLVIVVVSWGLLMAWVGALYVWAWKDDRRERGIF